MSEQLNDLLTSKVSWDKKKIVLETEIEQKHRWCDFGTLQEFHFTSWSVAYAQSDLPKIHFKVSSNGDILQITG